MKTTVRLYPWIILYPYVEKCVFLLFLQCHVIYMRMAGKILWYLTIMTAVVSSQNGCVFVLCISVRN